jgi:predicted dithiol-disulfide oxidoreductase (DUF899 family)
MSELRYPNESREYRDARDSLLKDEQELVDKVKSVAERRRNLPLGGELKEDYVFQWANDGKVGMSVKFSELFTGKNTLSFPASRRFRSRGGRRIGWAGSGASGGGGCF